MQVTDSPYPSMSTFLTGGVEGPEGGESRVLHYI